jgi:polyisoprenoid-binding protein YceI
MNGANLKSVTVSIDVNSMYSDNDRLTSHLLSDDFFDVKNFATATFKSTAIEEKSVAGATHLIKGELDLHGVKKALAFPATIKTADGVEINAEFTINRMLWGIVYPGKSDDLIKEDVLIKSNLTFVNQK